MNKLSHSWKKKKKSYLPFINPVQTLLFFMAEYSSIVYVYHNLFIHLCINMLFPYLGYYKDAMSIGVHVSSYLFKLVFLFSSNKHSEVELLDHMVGNRWGNSGNSVRHYFFGLQKNFRW